MSVQRLARLLPWMVLTGTVIAGVLAMPWAQVISPRAFEYAVGGCVLFFVTRYFHRRFRVSMRFRPEYITPGARARKLSPAQKKDRRREIRKATRMVRMPGR